MEENKLVEGMTKDIFSFMYAAFLSKTPLSLIA